MGDYISLWLISVRFIALNSWCRASDGGSGRSLVSRLRTAAESVPGWRGQPGTVACSCGCPTGPSDNGVHMFSQML